MGGDGLSAVAWGLASDGTLADPSVADDRCGVRLTSRTSSLVAPGPGNVCSDWRSRASPHALQVICPVVTLPQLRCSIRSGSLPSPYIHWSPHWRSAS